MFPSFELLWKPLQKELSSVRIWRGKSHLPKTWEGLFIWSEYICIKWSWILKTVVHPKLEGERGSKSSEELHGGVTSHDGIRSGEGHGYPVNTCDIIFYPKKRWKIQRRNAFDPNTWTLKYLSLLLVKNTPSGERHVVIDRKFESELYTDCCILQWTRNTQR